MVKTLEARVTAPAFDEFVKIALDIFDLTQGGRIYSSIIGAVDHVFADGDQAAAHALLTDPYFAVLIGQCCHEVRGHVMVFTYFAPVITAKLSLHHSKPGAATGAFPAKSLRGALGRCILEWHLISTSASRSDRNGREVLL